MTVLKVTQQDSKDSEKPSRSKDDNIYLFEENPPEKVQSTPQLVIKNVKKTQSEIIWALKCITYCYSNSFL